MLQCVDLGGESLSPHFSHLLYCIGAMSRPDCVTHKWVPPTRKRVPLGLLTVVKNTFAGADPWRVPLAPVGAAGFSLRARGLKPTALFSGPSAASRRAGVRNAGYPF